MRCSTSENELPTGIRRVSGTATRWWCARPAFATASGWIARGTRSLPQRRLPNDSGRRNYGQLDVDITIDDPKAYTAPWTVTLKQTLVVDTELIDYHCAENERDAAHYLGKQGPSLLGPLR